MMLYPVLDSVFGGSLALGKQASASLITAAQAATGTVGTATGSVSGTLAVPSATSIPLDTIAAATPIASGGSIGIHNPLDWGWITGYPQPAMGQFAWVFFIVLLAVFVGAIYFLFVLRPRYRESNTLNYRVIGKYAPWFLGVSAPGLFFVLLRLPIWNSPYGAFELGGQRIWLYLILIALIAVAVWFFRYYPNKYRADLVDWQKRAVKRQYSSTNVRRSGLTTTPGGSPTGVKRRTRR